MKIEKIRYSSKYNLPRILVTPDRYLRKYYLQAAAGSSELKSLTPEIIDRVAALSIAHMRRTQRVYGVIVAMLVGLAIINSSERAQALLDGYIFEIVAVLVFIVEFCGLYRLRRPDNEWAACDQLFRVIWEIGLNPGFLADAVLKGHIARHLEFCARSLERIPLSYKKIAPSVRRDALGTAAKKAQAVRDLELEIIRSHILGQPDLVKRLTEDMSSIALGHWFDLPEADFRHEVRRWVVVSQIAGAIGIIAMIASVFYFASKVGPAASVIVTILSAIAVGLLNRAGIPMMTVNRETGAAEKISEGEK